MLQKTKLLMLMLSLPLVAGAGIGPEQAINPGMTADSYYLSADGISRFDRVSGKRLWRMLPGKQLHEPVMAGSLVLVAGADGLFGLDRESGSTIWKRLFDSPAFSPVLDRGTAYVTTQGGRLYAFSPQDGAVRWSRQLTDGWIYPPAVDGRQLMTGGQDGVLWAVDKQDGQILWQRDLGQELVYQPVMTVSGQLLATTFSGELIALDRSGGRLLWRLQLPTPNTISAVDETHILLTGIGGTLRMVDGKNGRLCWEKVLHSRLAAPPVMRAGRVLAVLDEGRYLLLDKRDGRVLGRGQLAGRPLGNRFISPNQAIIFLAKRNGSAPLPVQIRVNEVMVDHQ